MTSRQRTEKGETLERVGREKGRDSERGLNGRTIVSENWWREKGRGGVMGRGAESVGTIRNYTAGASHAESGQHRPLCLLESTVRRIDRLYLDVYRPPLFQSSLRTSRPTFTFQIKKLPHVVRLSTCIPKKIKVTVSIMGIRK